MIANKFYKILPNTFIKFCQILSKSSNDCQTFIKFDRRSKNLPNLVTLARFELATKSTAKPTDPKMIIIPFTRFMLMLLTTVVVDDED